MLKRFVLLIVVTLLVSGCATKITDFTDRSLVYGWLDIKEVDANRLHFVDIHQFTPRVKDPSHSAEVLKFKDGYLYYNWTVPNGAHKLESAQGQYCAARFLCSNTIYQYSFGKQGDDVGAVIIKSPGAYHLGSYKLKSMKGGTFDVIPAANGPSRREMLEEIQKKANDMPPLIADRLKAELARAR